MRKIPLILMVGCAIMLAGCDPNNRTDRTAGGALLGGATGAAIGAASSRHAGTGALIGGAIGAAGGALIGSATTPDQPPPPRRARCSQWTYDDYGNRVCVGY